MNVEMIAFMIGALLGFAGYAAAISSIAEWHADFREKVERDISPLINAYLAHLWVRRKVTEREARERTQT